MLVVSLLEKIKLAILVASTIEEKRLSLKVRKSWASAVCCNANSANSSDYPSIEISSLSWRLEMCVSNNYFAFAFNATSIASVTVL